MRGTVAVSLSALAFAPALAFAEQQEERSSSALSENNFVRSLQIGLNVVTAYHALSLPHEAVHGAVGTAFGMPPTSLNIGIMKESISFDQEEERNAVQRWLGPLQRRLGSGR